VSRRHFWAFTHGFPRHKCKSFKRIYDGELIEETPGITRTKVFVSIPFGDGWQLRGISAGSSILVRFISSGDWDNVNLDVTGKFAIWTAVSNSLSFSR
jgi:hypothetical protein